jgi:polyhydroxybutyrate depolymerase
MRKIWKKLVIASTIPLLMAGVAMADTVTGKLNGRPYTLFTPSGIGANSTAPFLVAVHSGLSSHELFLKKLPMRKQAEKEGFRVIYINGTVLPKMKSSGRSVWNAGECCGRNNNADDVSYIDAVIKHFVNNKMADPNRIFMLGHSNGAMMAYRFVCERPGVVRGLVAISGPLAKSSCNNAGNINILHIHGAEDGTVPAAGGRGKGVSGSDFRSVAHTQNALSNAGANMEIQILPGGEHDLRGLNRAYLRTYRKTIPMAVSSFMR